MVLNKYSIPYEIFLLWEPQSCEGAVTYFSLLLTQGPSSKASCYLGQVSSAAAARAARAARPWAACLHVQTQPQPKIWEPSKKNEMSHMA